jgi:O-antigen/teichoic acid export membrane protein
MAIVHDPEADTRMATGVRTDLVAPRSLRANFSWTLAGSVVYAACQWGMLIVLAKLGSPTIVGQFALGLAVTTPVIMFANLQLRGVQATDAKRQYLFGHYLGLRLITTTLAQLVVVAIVFAVGYRWETALVILAVSVAKGLESVSDVFYGLLQQHERMDRVATSLMIKGPLSLLALGVGMLLTGSVLVGVLGLAVVWAILLLGYDVRSGAMVLSPSRGSWTWVRPRWAWGPIGRLAWLASPLAFVMMLGSLNTSLPRYFVERSLGEAQLGIFTAIAYLIVAGETVVGAMGQSAGPRLARYYAQGDARAFRALLGKQLGIAGVLGVAGILAALLAGAELLSLLYGPFYADHGDLLRWVMVAAAATYVASALGYAMASARYFGAQVPLVLVVAGVSTIACSWLIPTHGLRGGAMAMVLAALVWVAGSGMMVAHALRRGRPR